ncbi:MAG: TRAP transporter large permease subunit [Rhodobacteraceae bacterium]|nr:TRAP transporter large permease subunit [Paracoccaceae bacterium]
MVENLWLITLGVALLGGILSGLPVMMVLAGVPVAVAALAASAGAFDLVFLQAYPQRIFGVMGNGLLIAVPLFVLMGTLLERSRLAERMLLSAAEAMGGSGRALALSVLLVSTLIAASTGIIGATIVMLGLISLPALLQANVPERLASGLVCAAGTLGQIIPPSIVLILLGDQISNAYLDAQQSAGNFAPDPVTIGDLFAGALLPGAMLVGFYALWVIWRLPATPRAPTDRGTASTMKLVADIVPPVLLIVAVLGAILAGVATPTEAAAVGAAGALLLTAGTEAPRLQWVLAAGTAAGFAIVALKLVGIAPVPILFALTGLLLVALVLAAALTFRTGALGEAFAQTVQVSAMIFGIILAASMLSLVFRGFGGDDVVHDLLTALPGGPTGMLLATLLVVFLLGFVLEFVEIVFITVPIVGPVLLQHVDPVWFAVLLALNLQTSFLTPPFGFALFYFRSVAPPEITTAQIYRAIVPFVLIQLAALALVLALPPLATWLPSVLFG